MDKIDIVSRISGSGSLLLILAAAVFGSMGVHDTAFYYVTLPCGSLAMLLLAVYGLSKIVKHSQESGK